MIHALQVVAFDNPNPPDYGGAVEVFYKLKALHALGVKIDLHLFTYGSRKDYEILYEFCEKVYYYKRPLSVKSLMSVNPFIVKSREHPELLKNLIRNPSPILFEGLHTCAYLHRKELKAHFKMVRTHNVEHDYYKGLSKSSSNLLKKRYFKSEANKLRRFEPQLSHADLILALTRKDATHFQKYGETRWIPPFGKLFPKVEKIDDYVLFHGNLAVAENYEAAKLLVENVFAHIDSKVIVAGKSPRPSLVSAIEKVDKIQLIANPSQQEMERLVIQARCHVLYTQQNTGIKLKLVHAVQTVGHIVMNEDMLFDNKFSCEVELAHNWEEMIAAIKKCMQSDSPKSRDGLRALFDNKKNAMQILNAIESS